MQILLYLHDQGKTIVIVTHDEKVQRKLTSIFLAKKIIRHFSLWKEFIQLIIIILETMNWI